MSRDSKICGVALRVYNKKKGGRLLLKKPVQRLIPFEIMNCVKEGYENVKNFTVNDPQ